MRMKFCGKTVQHIFVSASADLKVVCALPR